MSSAEQQRTPKTTSKAPSPVSRSSSTVIRPGSGVLPSRTLDRTPSSRDRALNPLQQRQASGATSKNGGEQLASLSELQSLYETKEAEAKAHTAVMNDRIKQNRQTWMTLKQENKELQALMAERGGAAMQAEGKHPVEKQLEQLEIKVHELRRQHDKVMQEKKTTISKLQYRQDSLEHVSRGTGVTGPGAPVGAGMCTREAREMRQLENRLDKAVLKANEAQSIRHTYEQVLHQLQQDQLAFDPCVKALETALKTKTAEQQQALLEQREAQRLKEAAKHELSTVEERLASERLERQARLQAQRSAVRTLGEANSALLARQMQGAASVGVALGGKVTGAGLAAAGLPEGAPPPLVVTPQEAVAALLAAVPSCRLHTLCDHLLAQQETLHSLTEMKHAAVHKVSECSTELAAAQGVIAELDSGGRARSTQAALDSAQARLAQANAQAEAAKSSHDLVMKAYVDVRAGVEHLASMLAPLPLPPGHIPVPMSDDTLGDVLAQCQQRLVASLAFIHTLPKAAALLDSMMQNPELSFGGSAGPADDGM